MTCKSAIFAKYSFLKRSIKRFLNMKMTKIIMAALLLTCAASVEIGAQIPVKQMVTVAESQQTLASAKHLEIESQFCRVTFVEAEGDAVSFVGKLEAMEESDAYKVNVVENGDVVKVGIEVPSDAKSSYAGEMTIGLKNGVDVKLVSTSGNVYVDGVSTSNININTTKGKVNVKNSGGKIVAETKNGDITVSKYDGEISLLTATGKVSIENSKGTLAAETSDGDLSMNACEGQISGKTIAGKQTYDKIGGNLSIKGSSGAVKVSDCELESITSSTKAATINFFKVKSVFHIETERGQIISASSANGVTLTGSSDFTTTEGKINLTLLNKKDELSFDLEHSQKGDIALIAKGERTTKKQLVVGKGAILVTGRSVIGSQMYK